MKRAAIIGTAGTWRETPWQDDDLFRTSLNDAFMLGMPMPRIGAWYELHPLDHFIFRDPNDQKPVTAADVPMGYYLRPKGYLDWLQQTAQRIPVYLQAPPKPGWGLAEQFPADHLVEQFRSVLFLDPTWPKPYVASGPSWMLMHLMAQGYDEISIYGIHLSTAKEYREQRPQFEMLLGYALGRGVTIHLPKRTPIGKGDHVYCYEPRRSQQIDGLRWQLQEMGKRASSLVGPQRSRANAEVADLQQLIARLEMQDIFQSPEWRV